MTKAYKWECPSCDAVLKTFHGQPPSRCACGRKKDFKQLEQKEVN